MLPKLKPLEDRIIVQRLESEEKTPSGLFVPDVAKEKPSRGIVLAIGPGRRLENGTRQISDLAVGDEIIFGKYSGVEVSVDGEKYLTMHENEIFGVIIK